MEPRLQTNASWASLVADKIGDWTSAQLRQFIVNQILTDPGAYPKAVPQNPSTVLQNPRDGSQVLTGLGTYAGGLVKIAEQTPVSVFGVNGFDFQGIPQNFRSLQIRLLARGDTAAFVTSLCIRMNGDGGASSYYTGGRMLSNGLSVTPTDGALGSYLECGRVPAASATANIAGHNVVEIGFYRDTTFHKVVQGVSGFNGNYSAGNAYEGVWGGQWLNTGPIDRLSLFPLAGSFIAGSICTLYGLA